MFLIPRRSCRFDGCRFKGNHPEGPPTQRHGIQEPVRQESIRLRDRRRAGGLQEGRGKESERRM